MGITYKSLWSEKSFVEPKIMETSKSMKWAVALMLGVVLLNLPSIFQLFVPDLYVGIYTESIAGLTKVEAQATNPGLYQVILLGFQAVGLSVFGYLILSVFIILIPYKRGERWAWFSLMAMWYLMWGVNIYLGWKSNDMLDVYYSIPAVVFVTVSLGISYKRLLIRRILF